MALSGHQRRKGSRSRAEVRVPITRRTSLDELPQLFNVLRGDMALVGPRPPVLDEDSRIEGWQRSRLQLSPGMTGPLRVFGSARIPLSEMVKIDYPYGANRSLWLDVKILLRTVSFVLDRRGLWMQGPVHVMTVAAGRHRRRENRGS